IGPRVIKKISSANIKGQVANRALDNANSKLRKENALLRSDNLNLESLKRKKTTELEKIEGKVRSAKRQFSEIKKNKAKVEADYLSSLKLFNDLEEARLDLEDELQQIKDEITGAEINKITKLAELEDKIVKAKESLKKILGEVNLYKALVNEDKKELGKADKRMQEVGKEIKRYEV